jgi:hypothetical protein
MALINLQGNTKIQGKTIFETGYKVSDSDAAAYIANVEAADGATLEDPVKQAIDAFVLGCKSDSIWSALKASCILAGAKTLNGALVPLVGTSPTNYNFVSGDYHRELGLRGDGATKYLNANRLNNDDPQDSKHVAINIGSLHTSNVGQYLLASGNSGAGETAIFYYAAKHPLLSPNGNGSHVGPNASIGFKGTSRSNSASSEWRSSGAGNTHVVASQTPSSNATLIFRRGSGMHTTTQINFYSIGEAIDLSLLNTRVSTLMTDIAAAI